MAKKSKSKESQSKSGKGKGKKHRKEAEEEDAQPAEQATQPAPDAETQPVEQIAPKHSSPVQTEDPHPPQTGEDLPPLPDSVASTPFEEPADSIEEDIPTLKDGSLGNDSQNATDSGDLELGQEGDKKTEEAHKPEFDSDIEPSAPADTRYLSAPDNDDSDHSPNDSSAECYQEMGPEVEEETPTPEGRVSNEESTPKIGSNPKAENDDATLEERGALEDRGRKCQGNADEEGLVPDSRNGSVLSPSPKAPKSAVTFAEPLNEPEDRGGGLTSPTTKSPLTQRLPTPASVPSPTPSERKPKGTPPPQPHFPNVPSPAPLPSPQYTFAHPHSYPYSYPAGHPAGNVNSPVLTSTAMMAPNQCHVGGASQDSGYYPSAMYSSYHQERQRRRSSSRGYSPYNHDSAYSTPKTLPIPKQQQPLSQNTDHGTAILNESSDGLDLLERIQTAIPDMYRLVASYQETQSQLTARDAENQQMQKEHEQSLMQKKFYIEALQDQMRKAANESAEECSKLKSRIRELRVELGGLQEDHKDAEESLTEAQRVNEELTATRAELNEEVEKLRESIEREEAAHKEALEKQKEHEKEALATQKEELHGYFEEIKNEDDRLAAEQLKAREKELTDEQDAMKTAFESEKDDLEKAKQNMVTDYESKLGEKQSDLDAKQDEVDKQNEDLSAKQAEIEGKEGELRGKKDELEAKQSEIEAKQDELSAKQAELEIKLEELSSARTELDDKKAELASKQADLDAVREQLAAKGTELSAKQEELGSKNAELESKQAEFDDAVRKHEEETGSLRESLESQTSATKRVEERILTLTAEFQEKEESWKMAREELEAQLMQKEEQLKETKDAKESLEREGKEREDHLNGVVQDMRETNDNLSKDREKLKKTLTATGEYAEGRAKGDSVFLECFDELSRLIVSVSKECCDYSPPADVLWRLPPGFPHFAGETQSSRELRSAYIQHIISKAITCRIFEPFLFTLGKRYDKTDIFFQTLSTEMRRKSVRREAVWRQQTLKAAYTAPNAKQSINLAAAVIVEDIVDQIRHFVDPSRYESVLREIRKIVKLAAETWRLVRVERELITATIPSAEDEQLSLTGWQEFPCDVSTSVSICPTESGVGETNPVRRPLLWMLPRIVREPCHEDLLTGDDEEKANACVYLPGVVLYSDSPCVVARRTELDGGTGNS